MKVFCRVENTPFTVGRTASRLGTTIGDWQAALEQVDEDENMCGAPRRDAPLTVRIQGVVDAA
jgi:hypothetical protein